MRYLLALLILPLIAAQDCAAATLLIKNARIHTAAERGAIDNGDVLIRDGIIRAVDTHIEADGDSEVIDAKGRPLTPGLFAGIVPMGLSEVSLVETTVEHGVALGPVSPQLQIMRPEFQPALAFNPHATPIAVNRTEGLTYALLPATAGAGGSIIAGQGVMVGFSGQYDAQYQGSNALFIHLGAATHSLAGNSRAAQYMLLKQAFLEARTSSRALENEPRLLTMTGREVLNEYLSGGRIVITVNRAADILQVLKLAREYGFRPIINGGAEAWRVAAALSEANVPVILNPLDNLPASFERLGARLDNAKLLQQSGVGIIFSLGGDAHNARKIRQAAGNAVAHGLDWQDALKAVTSRPAEIFGLGDRLGSIEPGKQADLVLWSGDPLEVTSAAELVWIAGEPMPMRSRQTDLLDRYLPLETELPRHYLKP